MVARGIQTLSKTHPMTTHQLLRKDWTTADILEASRIVSTGY